ncbi:MAG: alanine racemase, partial [Candidatus Moranbacteria bacterium]|nr:alanine racemase [Candidatus Moranbacteria bacterium]
MKILSYLREIKRSYSNYHPLIEVLIYQKNLLHNLHTFQRNYPRHKIAPVLKSNAYGHGLVPVAKILDNQRIPFLVVDSLFEARMLRGEGVKSPILIIGYTRATDIGKNNLKNVSFTITTSELLEELAKNLRTPQKLHLKIDTGMHRQGIGVEVVSHQTSPPEADPPLVGVIKQNKNIILEGICSHLASADSADKSYTLKQIGEWRKAVKIFKDSFPKLKFFHLAATAGSFYSTKIPANVIRLGLGLYGMDSSPFRKSKLRPVLETKTIVSGIKNINRGDHVGYGLTYQAKKKIKIAVIPAGYFEGTDRR